MEPASKEATADGQALVSVKDNAASDAEPIAASTVLMSNMEETVAAPPMEKLTTGCTEDDRPATFLGVRGTERKETAHFVQQTAAAVISTEGITAITMEKPTRQFAEELVVVEEGVTAARSESVEDDPDFTAGTPLSDSIGDVPVIVMAEEESSSVTGETAGISEKDAYVSAVEAEEANVKLEASLVVKGAAVVEGAEDFVVVASAGHEEDAIPKVMQNMPTSDSFDYETAPDIDGSVVLAVKAAANAVSDAIDIVAEKLSPEATEEIPVESTPAETIQQATPLMTDTLQPSTVGGMAPAVEAEGVEKTAAAVASAEPAIAAAVNAPSFVAVKAPVGSPADSFKLGRKKSVFGGFSLKNIIFGPKKEVKISVDPRPMADKSISVATVKATVKDMAPAATDIAPVGHKVDGTLGQPIIFEAESAKMPFVEMVDKAQPIPAAVEAEADATENTFVENVATDASAPMDDQVSTAAVQEPLWVVVAKEAPVTGVAKTDIEESVSAMKEYDEAPGAIKESTYKSAVEASFTSVIYVS